MTSWKIQVPHDGRGVERRVVVVAHRHREVVLADAGGRPLHEAEADRSVVVLQQVGDPPVQHVVGQVEVVGHDGDAVALPVLDDEGPGDDARGDRIGGSLLHRVNMRVDEVLVERRLGGGELPAGGAEVPGPVDARHPGAGDRRCLGCQRRDRDQADDDAEGEDRGEHTVHVQTFCGRV
jgi:hypothetical protein